MRRRIRFYFLLLAAVIAQTSAQSAFGQLSRARRAVRSNPVAAAQPTPEPKPAADSEPETPVPAPVAQRASPSPQPRPSAQKSAREKSTVPTGSLGRVRQQVRSVAAEQPVARSRSPKRSVSQRPTSSRFHNQRGRAPVHSFSRNKSCANLFAPSPCIHETVIINEVAPPPAIFEQRLLVEPPPVVERSSTTATGVTSFAEGCEPGQLSGRPISEHVGCLQFNSFPYEFGSEGIMAFGVRKEWSGSALFEYGSSFDGLDRRGFSLLLEHSSRIGFDMKWDSYTEDIGAGLTDELHLTDVNILFRVAQSPNYLVRAGIGANIMGDAFGTDGGFNLTAKADFFPAEPIVLSSEIDVGTVGDAELFHVAGKVGWMLNRFEIFGGYDYRTIGGVPLQGAMLGMQVWF